MSSSLDQVEQKLKVLYSKTPANQGYFIPSLWVDPYQFPAVKLEMNPYRFLLDKIKEIRVQSGNRPAKVRPQREQMVVYNMLARLTTAYDHDGNGVVDIGKVRYGMRETGTFVKSIALLPYITSLGVNTIYLLPVTSIGIDGRKGNLGSPYAIKNHYKIDENLAEPALDLPVEVQFAAFVEAAHMCGMKVITEFVFRTSSKDSDLAIEHPEWFYWIRSSVPDRSPGVDPGKSFGNPLFDEATLLKIKEKVLKGDYTHLPEPDEAYRKIYTDIPHRTARIENRVVGLADRDVKCRIPGAFCDWPPDDVQPPWDDVTYLRMYDHRDFNYMAYNTLRMYDERLAKPKNEVTDLWKYICEIIPYYQKNFAIDGVMIDMGHALPQKLRAEIVSKARVVNKDFIFWEENFVLTRNSVKEGYNAVVGYMWADQHTPHKLKELVELMGTGPGVPIPFFLTPETHNTPRAVSKPGNLKYSIVAWLINSFLPGVLFIHSGYELAETVPVNTGLGFTPEEQALLSQEKLPLFSVSSMNWENPDCWIDSLRQVNELKNRYLSGELAADLTSITALKSSCSSVVGFTRKTNLKGRDFVLILNMNPERELYFSIKLPEDKKFLFDINIKKKFTIINNELILDLKPFGFIIGELY